MTLPTLPQTMDKMLKVQADKDKAQAGQDAETYEVEIELFPEPYRCRVVVNGQELRSVRAVEIQQTAGGLPTATLELFPGRVSMTGKYEIHPKIEQLVKDENIDPVPIMHWILEAT